MPMNRVERQTNDAGPLGKIGSSDYNSLERHPTKRSSTTMWSSWRPRRYLLVNVPELLAAPEGKTLEFKRDLSSLTPILKTLVAFSNTSGGTLVIGVEDTGAVVGVANVLREEERLSNAIADSIRPIMTPEIDLVSHDGRTLLFVRVPPLARAVLPAVGRPPRWRLRPFRLHQSACWPRTPG